MIYCKCGCRQMRTKYAIDNGRERKDKPRTYINGHTYKNKKLSEEHKRKIGNTQKGKPHVSEEAKKRLSENRKGDKNNMWKGDDAGYDAIHLWINTNKPKPKDGLCERCHTRKLYDAANISGIYLRDFDDYIYLCRACHMVEDGRMMTNLKQYH